MNTKLLLSCVAAVALASVCSADQVQHTDPVTGESVTTRIPGSLPVEPERTTIESFDPTRAPREDCDMVITSQPVASPRFSSFARMPDTRRPRVACAPEAPVVTAVLFQPEPPRVIPPPPPVEPTYFAPEQPPPVIEELPHTGSTIPLLGLLSLLSLGGAALLRAIRR